MYGEASEGRYFQDPVLLYALVERSPQSNPVDEFGVQFDYALVFRFLYDDLTDLLTVKSAGKYTSLDYLLMAAYINKFGTNEEKQAIKAETKQTMSPLQSSQNRETSSSTRYLIEILSSKLHLSPQSQHNH